MSADIGLKRHSENNLSFYQAVGVDQDSGSCIGADLEDDNNITITNTKYIAGSCMLTVSILLVILSIALIGISFVISSPINYIFIGLSITVTLIALILHVVRILKSCSLLVKIGARLSCFKQFITNDCKNTVSELEPPHFCRTRDIFPNTGLFTLSKGSDNKNVSLVKGTNNKEYYNHRMALGYDEGGNKVTYTEVAKEIVFKKV